MISKTRKFLWRILGFDYQTLLKKMDYVLLKDDICAHLGHKSYDNGAKVWRWTDNLLIIGNYCSIASNVNFIIDEGFHNSSEITNYPFINNLTKNPELLGVKMYLKQREGIFIGNDVWIGMNSIILPGVRIGNGVTIAAGSTVTKDIADYAIVGGTPAKVIRMKNNDETIEKMNEIAWWNWEASLIEERIIDFYLPIQEFIKKYHED